MTVTIRHPHADLLADPDLGVARVWNDVLAGRWGIAADVCASRLTDPTATRRTLDDIGATFAVPDVEPLTATVHGDGTETRVAFAADRLVTGVALDLFTRILCGQWNEMRYHCALRVPEIRPDVDLTMLRVMESRPYDDTVAWDDRAFPPHANASISIAQATLPAKVAYHAYKALNCGAPGDPTFSLPDGPLTVEVNS